MILHSMAIGLPGAPRNLSSKSRTLTGSDEGKLLCCRHAIKTHTDMMHSDMLGGISFTLKRVSVGMSAGPHGSPSQGMCCRQRHASKQLT